tara:strand:+ start:448 stop:633 length:186 start_codon:yes stop_codon:yes gene_type:complete
MEEERIVTKEDLINDLIFYTQRSEELWEYHPSNPERINVEGEYEKILQLILECKENLNDFV